MSTKIITSEAHKVRDGKLDNYFIASIIFICNAVLDLFFSLISSYLRLHIVFQLLKGSIKWFCTIALESHTVSP